MRKRFPITQREFWRWLRSGTNKRSGTIIRCPVAQAVLDLTGEKISSGMYMTDSYPQWVERIAKQIDNLPRSPDSWTLRKRTLLKLLIPVLLCCAGLSGPIYAQQQNRSRATSDSATRFAQATHPGSLREPTAFLSVSRRVQQRSTATRGSLGVALTSSPAPAESWGHSLVPGEPRGLSFGKI